MYERTSKERKKERKKETEGKKVFRFDFQSRGEGGLICLLLGAAIFY